MYSNNIGDINLPIGDNLHTSPTMKTYVTSGNQEDVGDAISSLRDRENEILLREVALTQDMSNTLKELLLNLTLQRGVRTYSESDKDASRQDAFIVGQIYLLKRMLAHAKSIK